MRCIIITGAACCTYNKIDVLGIKSNHINLSMVTIQTNYLVPWATMENLEIPTLCCNLILDYPKIVITNTIHKSYDNRNNFTRK